MPDSILASIAGLPAFLSFFVLAILLVLLFCRFYSWVTPHDEFALIRANNPAAAIAFVGALIGFAGPRVIRETIGKDLPKGFQSAEFVLEHGFLDFIIDRRSLKQRLSTLLKMLQ